MKTRILIGAALLLSTAGIALAAAGTDHLARPTERHLDHHERGARDGGHGPRLTERDHYRDRDTVSSKRRHHDHDDDHDDDDDDDDHRGRRALQQTGPSDPHVPVPDNGLFQGKARPKVEVR